MRTTRLKDLCLTATFVFITVCAMMFAGCPLEDNDALWKSVAGETTSTSSTSNPFEGTTWSGSYYGESMVLSFTSSTWSAVQEGYPMSGNYTRNGNTATLRMYEDGYYMEIAEATISGNNLTLRIEGETITLTKGSGSGGGTVPSAPSSVTASASSSSSITVSWNTVSGATNYYIYRSSSASGSYNQIGQSYSSTSYTDSGLSANTTYYYKVAAVNSSGTGSQSSYTSATTSSSGYSSGPPNAPTGVTASATSSSSITVSWSSVSGATSYIIYRSSSSSGTYTQVGTSTTTSYTNTGLTANTTYYYKVAAVNSSGTGSQSSYTSATTSSSSSGSSPISLTYDEMYDNYLPAGAVHQYRFYASSGSYYYVFWQDVDNSDFTADIRVGVKREGASTYIVDLTDSGNSGYQNDIEFYVSTSGYYIIEVQGLSSSSSGSYSVGYWSD